MQAMKRGNKGYFNLIVTVDSAVLSRTPAKYTKSGKRRDRKYMKNETFICYFPRNHSGERDVRRGD